MFLFTGDEKYYDIIERTLYNGLIAGISLDGKEFFYPNPLTSDGKYAFNQGGCTREPWFDCSCCPTNLIRFIPSVSNLTYATGGDSLYVNLFMSNEAHITVDNKRVDIAQQTNYPWNDDVMITVNPEKKSEFTLKVIIPGWTRGIVAPGGLYSFQTMDAGSANVTIDGVETGPVDANGYVSITRKWKKGDVVNINFPMDVRRVVTRD